jgi:signal transduction histidine kinase
MPIIVHEEIIGTVGLDSVVRRAFQPHEISLVRNVAASVGQALSNARLIEQLQAELAERKRAESELKQAKEAAEAASRAKSAFLAQMSHELRTPLNSIIGYADMIMQGMYGELNEKQNNRLERVTRNGHHLLQIINDILDLSKIEAGYLDIDTHPFIIEGAVNECLTAMTPLATRKGLSLKGETPEELSAVKADRGRTVQILNNLVGNAVKFTEQGGITVTVKEIPPSELESLSTRLRPGDSPWVLVQVKDTGIGISQEHLDAVFEEFHQVDNTTTRQYEGTGLGLAISRRLARLMRGDLWAESAVGEGSTFSLLLPTTTESSGESRTSIVRAPTTQDGPSPLG